MRRFKIKAHAFEDSGLKTISVIEASNLIEALDIFEDSNPMLMPDEITDVTDA